MNILFVTGQITPLSDANTLIMMRLANELINQQSSISITFLGINETPLDLKEAMPNGISINEFRPNKRMVYSDALQSFLKQTSALGTKKRIKKLVICPSLALELIIKRCVNGSLSEQYSRELKKICAQQSFDAIVGVSAPFHAPFGIAKTKNLNIPFIYYQLDPYFSHYLQHNKNKSLRQEEMVCKRATYIVMTDLIQKDYQNSILKKNLNKSSILAFPAFSDSAINSSSISYDLQLSPTEIPRLVFVGSLYGDIRSPLYLLKMAYLLKVAGHRIHIDFVGPILQALDTEVNQYIDELGSDVEFHGKVSSEEAKKWLIRADILVNIANAIPNQLPSKIFEYFSSGKPILNIYKLRDCPTLEYMRVYPYSLSLPEFQDVDETVLRKVIDFCKNMRGLTLTYNQVSGLFPEYTIQAVGAKFLQLIFRATEK